MIIIKRLLGQLRRAINDYEMIKTGDKICVGVSGGKDSLTLLTLLAQTRRYYPEKFELEAVTLKMGIDDPDFSSVAEYCKKLGVNYTILETQIAQIVFVERKEENPCSLCANMRRGALHNIAKELGCNKVALGHHRDDVLETFLMSTFYEGRLHTFSPVTYLDRTDLHLIRPMIYIEEKDIKRLVKDKLIDPVPKTCRIDGHTNREYFKNLLYTLQEKNHDVKNILFGAIKRAGKDNW